MLAHAPILVLNGGGIPIDIIQFKRAINLLFKLPNEKAKVHIVHPESFAHYTWEDWTALKPNEDDKVIKTKDSVIKLPEIIILSDYYGYHNKKLKYSRKTLFRRDNYECQYCGSKQELTIDHILPRSKGGLTTWENTVACCFKCNVKKADKMLKDCGFTLRKKPAIPKAKYFRIQKKTSPKSWENFLSEVYWNIELENDNP